MKHAYGVMLAAMLAQAAVAAPLNLKQLRQLAAAEGDISAQLAPHGFKAYGTPIQAHQYRERNYADDAKHPRNISVVVGEGSRRHESRLSYDTYDIPEARNLQNNIERAGFKVVDEGEVARARYRLLRHRDGSEIQINLPKRRGAAVGFVFYRYAPE